MASFWKVSKTTLRERPLEGGLAAIYLLILALIPFHAFVTTWAASYFGQEELIKSWKEFLLALAGLVLAGLLIRYPKQVARILIRPVNLLILLYAIWHLILTLAKSNAEPDAILVGLAMNLRYLWFFIMAQVLVAVLNPQRVRRWAVVAVTFGLTLVLAFGTLQVVVLPADILTHFGYNRYTIKPYLTIDENPNFVRINSFLRGPNPLGAYTAMLLPLLSGLAWRMKRRKWALILAGAGIITLYGSYSRSAWVGFAVMLAALALATAVRRRWYGWLAGAAIGAVLVLGTVHTFFQDSRFYSLLVLHSEPEDANIKSSNTIRAKGNAKAWQEFKEEPLGRGPGTAGPASFYNRHIRVVENYYLQLLVEVGFVGLIMFVLINLQVAWSLWRQRAQFIPLILLAGWLGLAVMNWFVPAWADETTALTWWGLAGLFMGIGASYNKTTVKANGKRKISGRPSQTHQKAA